MAFFFLQLNKSLIITLDLIYFYLFFSCNILKNIMNVKKTRKLNDQCNSWMRNDSKLDNGFDNKDPWIMYAKYEFLRMLNELGLLW